MAQIEALSGSTPSSRADIELTIPGYNAEDDSPWLSVSVDWDSQDSKKHNPVMCVAMRFWINEIFFFSEKKKCVSWIFYFIFFEKQCN